MIKVYNGFRENVLLSILSFKKKNSMLCFRNYVCVIWIQYMEIIFFYFFLENNPSKNTRVMQYDVSLLLHYDRGF